MPGELDRDRTILGIDPGLARVGWGVIDTSGPSLRILEYGAISTSPELAHAERLDTIYSGLLEVVRRHHPGVAAIEEIFQGKSVRSGMQAGEGRAVCILAAKHGAARVVEYPAATIKRAVTGNGRASKPQIQGMICRLLGLAEVPRPHDAADALAVAVTHFQRGRSFAARMR